MSALTNPNMLNRQEALEWWRAFNDEEQYEIIRNWQSFSQDSRSKWSPIMIQHSSSCIQIMYTELKLKYAQ